jgi:hypothetical protein
MKIYLLAKILLIIILIKTYLIIISTKTYLIMIPTKIFLIILSTKINLMHQVIYFFLAPLISSFKQSNYFVSDVFLMLINRIIKQIIMSQKMN